jgi:hypothetical protein
MDLPDVLPASILYLGIDDFSFQRGYRFGTILVDLESRRVVDLLPDREAKTSAAWMRQHPDLMAVSRDRGGEYASERLAHYEQVVALRKLGLSQAAIARQVGIGASTVQSWLAAGTFASAQTSARRPATLIAISPVWSSVGKMGATISPASSKNELVERRYQGSYESVRNALVRRLPNGRKNALHSSLKAPALATARQATFLVPCVGKSLALANTSKSTLFQDTQRGAVVFGSAGIEGTYLDKCEKG